MLCKIRLLEGITLNRVHRHSYHPDYIGLEEGIQLSISSKNQNEVSAVWESLPSAFFKLNFGEY